MPVISCNLKKTIKNRFKEKFKNADFECKIEPFSPFCKTFPHTTKPDLDGNQFAQVYNISHHFYLSCLRHVRNFTLNRMFLGMHCKNYIKLHAFENNLLATGCYISSVKIRAEYCKKDFLVLIYSVCSSCLLYTVHYSQFIFLMLTLKCLVITESNQSLQ